jgi:hypothetical protein
MKTYTIAAALGMFALGIITGVSITNPVVPPANAATEQVSVFDLMANARDLPVHTSDNAI